MADSNSLRWDLPDGIRTWELEGTQSMAHTETRDRRQEQMDPCPFLRPMPCRQRQEGSAAVGPCQALIGPRGGRPWTRELGSPPAHLVAGSHRADTPRRALPLPPNLFSASRLTRAAGARSVDITWRLAIALRPKPPPGRIDHSRIASSPIREGWRESNMTTRYGLESCGQAATGAWTSPPTRHHHYPR